VVLGGGVVGLCCAKSLLEAGLHVALVERADTAGAGVGGAATGAGQVRELAARVERHTLSRVGSGLGGLLRLPRTKPLALVLCPLRPFTYGASLILRNRYTLGRAGEALGRNRSVGS
jgi:hypothetical protein